MLDRLFIHWRRLKINLKGGGCEQVLPGRDRRRENQRVIHRYCVVAPTTS
jgi:hypothetical protein